MRQILTKRYRVPETSRLPGDSSSHIAVKQTVPALLWNICRKNSGIVGFIKYLTIIIRPAKKFQKNSCPSPTNRSIQTRWLSTRHVSISDDTLRVHRGTSVRFWSVRFLFDYVYFSSPERAHCTGVSPN